MGIYKRLPRTKVVTKDEFISWSVRVLHWVAENWKVITITAALSILVVSLFLGWTSYQSHRQSRATEDWAAVREIEAGSSEQIQAGLKLIKDYPQTPAAYQARMFLGTQYFSKKLYPEALEQFEQLAQEASSPVLKVAAWHRQAQVLASLDQWDKAAEVYLKASKLPENLLALESRYLAAQCYEKLENYSEAEKMYKQIIQEAADDVSLKSKSEDRLLWLNVRQSTK